jgi:hypothetical protein
MEVLYHAERMAVYERRAKAGRRLACQTQAADLLNRKAGKALRVSSFSQGEGRVPSIRVAGKWLQAFGFELGDEVTLTAKQGRIVIAKKGVQGNGNSMV